jgi:hypothetical protein
MVDTENKFPNTPGKNRTFRKVEGLPLEPYNNHQYKQIWNQKVAGYTLHTFSDDYTSLKTDFLTYVDDSPVCDLLASVDVDGGKRRGWFF